MKSILSMLTLIIMLSSLNAAVIHVPDGYTTLEEAVTAAVTGDTILVNPGVFETNLVLENKDLVIASRFILSGNQDDIDNTILQSVSTFNPIILYKTNITSASRLIGFTMDGELQSVYAHVRIREGASPGLENLRLINQGYSDLPIAAILIESASADIRNCRIENNLKSGVYLDASHATLSHSTISNNENIGIVLGNNSTAQISFTDILENHNGAIHSYSSTVHVSDSRIMNNTRFAGAGFQSGYTDFTFERVLITGNVATGVSSGGAGGGIYLQASNGNIINCTIADNSANQWAGGLFTMVSNVNIVNSIVWGNDANGLPEIGCWSNSQMQIAYSNVRGGPTTQSTMYGGVINWLDNNLGNSVTSHYPAFDTDYHLTANSPCIDEGAAVYSMGNELIVDMPLGSWSGGAPDMGVYEFEDALTSLLADFTVLSSPHGPAPLSVRFSDMSTAENTHIVSWEWDFGDGGNSNLQAPVHIYETPGTYTVTLTISDGDLSDSHTIEDMVIVFPPELQAGFTFSPGNGPLPLTVRFTDQSTGPVESRLWDFGDGDTSTQTHPEHVYNNPGIYDVTLFVANDFTSDMLTIHGAVTALEPVTYQSIYVSNDGSDVTGDGSANNPFATIQHGINMASDFDTVIVKDGVYHPADNDDFDFMIDGKEIVLTSENGPENCILEPAPEKWMNSIKVTHAAQSTLISGFTIRNAWAGVYVPSASPVIENCVMDSCFYGIITSRDWQMDDPPASSPIIRYNLIKNSEQDGIALGEGGTPLIINNTIVNSEYIGISVMVYGEVINNICTGNGTGISGLEDNQINIQYNCVWNNGTDYTVITPGTGDINLDPLFTEDYHLQPGSPVIDAGHPGYTPDPDGTRADMGAYYYHQENLEWAVDFTADVLSGRAPLLVNFTDLSTGEGVSWNWDFGDQITSQTRNPAHIYTTPGSYTVSLTVSDGTENKQAEKSAYITVHEPVHQNPVDSPFEQLSTLPGNEGDHYLDGAFLTKDLVYLVSNKNKLYKTTDGGDSWIDISPEAGTDFSGLGASAKVSFINENIGTVAFSLDDGSNNYDYNIVFGYVWCTTDGGQTWSQRFDVNDDMITHLQQVNENTVYISGAARLGVTSTRWFKKIMRDPETGNFNLSSITPTPTSRPHVFGGHWLHQNTGAVLARLNVAPWTMEPFITRDGGQSWQSIRGNLPVLDNTSIGPGYRNIQMLDENTIILTYSLSVNGVYQTHIWRTDNGAAAWYESSFDVQPYMLVNIRIDPVSGTGYAAGWHGDKALYMTADFGASWTQKTPGPVPDELSFYGVDIASDGTVWAFGPNQTLWRTRRTMTPEFSADVTQGPVPLEVHFTDLTIPGMAPVTDIHWDFGDGNTSEEQNPVHTYTIPGTYTITFMATDTSGSYQVIKENYIIADVSVSAMIHAVMDVPEDQGGWVTVYFTRSYYDTRPAEPTGKSMADTIGLYTVEIHHEGEWILANSTAAYARDTYEILVHTLADSSIHGDGLHDFRIISAFPDGRYISPTVQGYSVDNLAPAVPAGPGANWLSDHELQLSWTASTDPDFAYYILWKSMDPAFDPMTIDPLIHVADTMYVDSDVQPGIHYYYRLAAVDHHGNMSELTPALDAHAAGILGRNGTPDHFELSTNFPNPFNPYTTIPYQIPENTHVNIQIFDLSGRHIQTLVNTYQSTGYYDLIWNGTDFHGKEISSGMYIVRMQTKNFHQTMKIVFMK